VTAGLNLVPDWSAADASAADALLLSGVRRTFGTAVAVERMDLAVRSGEFYALLGPNGAGKTTTLRMIAGLLRPDSGTISIFGIDTLKDPLAAKRITAWLPDEPMLYDKLTPLEYLWPGSGPCLQHSPNGARTS
jgi:ABC-2 type transport system ATP-binding protein